MKSGSDSFEDIGSIQLLAVPGRSDDSAIVNPSGASLLVWPIGILAAGSRSWVTPGNSIEEVKPMIRRTISERLGEVRIRPALCMGAILLAISKAQMPLPHHSGLISVAAEQRGDRRAGLLDQGIALDAKKHPVFKGSAPAVASGQ